MPQERRIRRSKRPPRLRGGSFTRGGGAALSPGVAVEPASFTGAFAWVAGAVTATGMAFGAAPGPRVIVAVISSRADADLASVTIGGVSATKASNVRNAAATPDTSVEIWFASVPTGSSGSVVATTSDVATTTRVGITLFALTGGVGQAGPVFDTQNTATGALDTAGLQAAINVTRSSVTIAGAIGLNGAGNVTWTNMTEYSDFSAGTDQVSTAAYRTDSLTQSVTPNATSASASANCAFAVASFR